MKPFALLTLALLLASPIRWEDDHVVPGPERASHRHGVGVHAGGEQGVDEVARRTRHCKFHEKMIQFHFKIIN